MFSAKAVVARRSRPSKSQRLNIRRKNHLARRLGIDLKKLETVARYVRLHYNPTQVREKKDKTSVREIDAPKPLLKGIQRQIHWELLAPLWLPDSIHAYRTGRSNSHGNASTRGAGILLGRGHSSILSEYIAL